MSAYLRTPLRSDPTAAVRDQLNRRATVWLDLVKRGVFGHDSVYAELFDIAGCTYGDLEAAVLKDGLEATLAALRDSGVYLTHDEFKQKVPIVRSGRTVSTTKRSFTNPLISGWLDTASSGSRSAGSKSSHNTALTLHREGYWDLHFREHGIRECASLQVRPVLPSAAGLVIAIAYARLG